MARVGDLDGDGFGDLAVGLPGAAGGDGSVRLVRGGPGGLSTEAPTPSALSGDFAGAAFGSSLAFLGDVDGDGFGDLAVGAPEHSNPEPGEGRVYVFFGRAGGFDPTRTWTLEPNRPGLRFGAKVAAAGDFDGDGRSDLWVATAPGDGPGTVALYRSRGLSLETTPTWTTEGTTVAGAGDVDGDGKDDVVIGDPGANNQAGRCRVFLGTASDVPVLEPLRDIVGEIGERLGASVAMVGDVDGDGLSDFVCGAPGALGGAGGLRVEFGDPTRAALAFTGDTFGVRGLGVSLAPAGDVNGDGLADVVVGAGGDGDGHGLVLAGSTRNALSTLLWQGRCVACIAGHDYGTSVAPLGDLNGDGFADVGVGAPSLDIQDGFDTGVLEVDLGAPTPPAELGEPFGFGEREPSQRNLSLAATLQGDRSGDGTSVLAIGDPGRPPPGRPEFHRAGLAEAYRYELDTDDRPRGIGLSFSGAHTDNRVGASVAWVDLGNRGTVELLIGQPGLRPGPGYLGAATFWYFWEVHGLNDGAAIGASIAAVGDVDGDGLQDFAVGGPGERLSPTSDRVGTAVIFRGSPAILGNPPKLVAPVESWRGFGATPNAELGAVVAAAGDVDGDTFSDVLIAAPGESKVYLLRGDPETLGPLEALPIPLGLDHRGVALASFGDLNGDRLADFGVGLPDGRGRVFVFYGGRTELSMVEVSGENLGDQFGASIAGAGDIDQDGHADLLIGAPGVDGAFADAGRVSIYRGTTAGLDTTPYWVLEGDRTGASLGDLVVGGGDLDGDAFPDFGVVARDLSPTPGSMEATRLFVFRGNGGTTSIDPPRPTQRRVAGPQAISPYGASNLPNGVSLQVLGRSPFGTGRLRLETAVSLASAPNDSPTRFSEWVPYLGEAIALRHTIDGLTRKTAYRWRTRVHYDLVRAPPQATSRWYLGGVPGQPSQVHFRTRDNVSPVAASDTYTCVSDVGLDVVAVPPNAASPGLLANDSDGDFDTLVVSLPDGSLSGPTAHGTIVLSREGGFRYRPEPGFVGVDRFRYRVSDEVGGDASAEVTMVVVPAGCDPSVVGVCGRGDVRGTLETTGGPRGFACRVQVTAGVRSLVCDHRDGVLTLGEPVCE